MAVNGNAKLLNDANGEELSRYESDLSNEVLWDLAG